MKFLVDVNIPPKVTAYIESLGHDVKSLVQEQLSNIPDERVMELALNEERTIITFDKHFGNILRYPPQNTAGIILLRIHPPLIEKIISAFDRFFKRYGETSLKGRLIVLSDKEYRMRMEFSLQ